MVLSKPICLYLVFITDINYLCKNFKQNNRLLLNSTKWPKFRSPSLAMFHFPLDSTIQSTVVLLANIFIYYGSLIYVNCGMSFPIRYNNYFINL